MSDRECLELMDEAAWCLLEVALADPFTTPPQMRTECLWAVEMLATLGADPLRHPPRPRADPYARLREALALLAALPPSMFAEAAVLDAAEAAQAALAAFV